VLRRAIGGPDLAVTEDVLPASGSGFRGQALTRTGAFRDAKVGPMNLHLEKQID